MHRLLPVGAKAGSWSPRLSPWFVRACGLFRPLIQRRLFQIESIEWDGVEHLASALQRGDGVLIIANHYTYADPFILAAAADTVRRPFYFMTAWQVFGTSGWLKQETLRRLGCFSVDREGTDARSIRTAVEILQTSRHPLVIFPEGEMYHTGDRVMPFHEGPAGILLIAAKRSPRPLVCIPAAFKYYYTADPAQALASLAGRLEESLHWRQRPDMNLEARIQRLAAGALALKELEHLGQTQSGTLPDRLIALAECLLARLEQKYGVVPSSPQFPQRVRSLRQRVLNAAVESATDDAVRQPDANELEELFLVTQLMSYPANYLADNPSIERVAETLDKLEEDVLGVPLAAVRGPRRAKARFGAPLGPYVPGEPLPRAADLCELFETRVQSILDGIT